MPAASCSSRSILLINILLFAVFRRHAGKCASAWNSNAWGQASVVRATGIIREHNHVVEGGQRYRSGDARQREFKAKVLLDDPRVDMALLKIGQQGRTLPDGCPLPDSDTVQVAIWCWRWAIPWRGPEPYHGHCSALARSKMWSASDYQFFILFFFFFFYPDRCAINPGTSGGALITTDGRLAGINTAIVRAAVAMWGSACHSRQSRPRRRGGRGRRSKNGS